MSSFSSSARTSLLVFSSSIRADAMALPRSMLRVSGRTTISSAVSCRESSSRSTSKACWRDSAVVVLATSSIAERTTSCWARSWDTTSPVVASMSMVTCVTWVIPASYPEPSPETCSVGEVLLRPEGSLRPVGDADRLEDAGQVRLDGALRDTETPRDLLVGEPLAHQVEHLTLTGGEPVGGGHGRLLLPAHVEQDPRSLRVQRRLPGRRDPHRVGDLRRVTVLEQVAGRTRLERVEDALPVSEGRQDHDVDTRRVGEDAPGRLDAVDLRHRQVHQVDVRRRRRQQRMCLVTVCRRTDDLDVVLAAEELREALPHDGVVVDDRHPDHSGTSTWTVVPLPGVESTRTSPPLLRTRSRSVRSPTCPSATRAVIVSSSNPTSATIPPGGPHDHHPFSR